MKTYADANALVRLYLQLHGRVEAINFVNCGDAGTAWPLLIPDLLRMEVTNAIHRMVFVSRTTGQCRVTPEAAMIGLTEFSEHLVTGVQLRRVSLTLPEIEREFDTLAARHTAREGFRTYDVIHVASALTLRCARFLSFDDKANRLAKLVGLETL